jgi:hypothetical protein
MFSEGERISESKATILIVVAVRLGSVPLQIHLAAGARMVATSSFPTAKQELSPGPIVPV